MSRSRSRLLKSVELLLTFLMLVSAADKGYYGNSGSMNDAGDMEVHHISMPSLKTDNPRCEEINIPMCRGKFDTHINSLSLKHTLPFSLASQVSVTT
jgi:hypothetical protein